MDVAFNWKGTFGLVKLALKLHKLAKKSKFLVVDNLRNEDIILMLLEIKRVLAVNITRFRIS